MTTLADELEQGLLATVRRAHDEFAQNGFDTMAITMVKAEREIRQLAEMARRQRSTKIREALGKLANEVLASLPLMEPLARREFGNTNYNILVQQAEDARVLLEPFHGDYKNFTFDKA